MKSSKSTPSKHYVIKLKEKLDSDWSDWFDGFLIEEGESCTLLRGKVIDQAALHGLLIKIRDLGLTLVSVEELEE